MDTQGLKHEKASLLDFLPENTIVWMKDPGYIQEVILQMEERLDAFLQTGQKVEVGDDDTIALTYRWIILFGDS